MDETEFANNFWYFYLDLEQDFLEIEKTIPYDNINKNTFSYKYMGLLMSICSEIDFVFKKFIEFKDEEFPKNNLGDYFKFVNENFPELKNSEIRGYNHRFIDLKCTPFKYWDSNNSPRWWQVYNKIKHDRVKIKEENHEWYLYANQKNVLKALGGLFILNMYFYRECFNNLEENCKVPLPQSKIFNLENWGDYRENMIGNGVYIADNLNIFHSPHY